MKHAVMASLPGGCDFFSVAASGSSYVSLSSSRTASCTWANLPLVVRPDFLAELAVVVVFFVFGVGVGGGLCSCIARELG